MKQRLLVAAVGVPLLILVLVFLPPIAATILVAASAGAAAYELLHTAGKNVPPAVYVLTILAAVLTVLFCARKPWLAAYSAPDYRPYLYAALAFLYVMATNMNWSETYTALQQNTVEGQENPLPAIDAASVQEVQKYCSLWNANYDCLFFGINQGVYDALTPEQQEVVDEIGQKAVQYEREINRAGDDEILSRWQNENGVEVLKNEELDVESFKKAVDGIDEWFVEELKKAGYDDGQELVDAFASSL